MGDFVPFFSEMVKMLELQINSQILNWDEKSRFFINNFSLLGSHFVILTCADKSRAKAS
jgi:hypothetical protein